MLFLFEILEGYDQCKEKESVNVNSTEVTREGICSRSSIVGEARRVVSWSTHRNKRDQFHVLAIHSFGRDSMREEEEDLLMELTA